MKRYSSISKVLTILFLFFSLYTQAQGESANWYFGNFAGLTFNSTTPVALTDGSLATMEGCATISDPSGNLLFYTDGKNVWDNTHNPMPNGYDLMGDVSSTESAIIIPKPGSTTSYYIFTTDKPSYFLTPDDSIDGLNYTEVDMELNNGLGDVVVSNKNNHLITYDSNDPLQNEFKSSEKLTAVTHGNSSDIWVISQFIDKFFAFKVTASGVVETPVVSSVTQAVFPRINESDSNVTAIGYLKVSPNGEQIAIAHSSTSLGSPTTGKRKSGKVLLYDFNNTTGAVTNERLLLDNSYPYGVEFSPNSKLLYVTATQFDLDDIFIDSRLLQYNTESTNVVGSQTVINTSSNVAGALQLAIDGKIYRAGYVVFGEGTHLSVINNPNELGASSNYSHNSFYLNGRAAQIGLPPFIQSIFKLTFDFEDICFNDNTHFFITSEDPYDTILWDFGDGTTSANPDSYHTYAQPGDYNVTLQMSINGIDYNPIIKLVKIAEPPEVIQYTYDLVQCDSFDDDSTDGITVFSLNEANDALVIDPTQDFEVYYYHTLASAESDVDNEIPINPDYYTNQYDEEIVIAKVTSPNTICYNIAYVRLLTTQSVDVGTHQLETCDSNYSNSADFDLTIIRNQIINDLPLNGEITVNFYLSPEEAAGNLNSLPDTYNSGSNTLYVSIDNENVCYGNGLVELILGEFPFIDNQSFDICQSDFPLTIDFGLSTEAAASYDVTWSTNQTTNSIEVSQAGTYSVTITDPILDCEKTIDIVVTQIPLPEIESITIADYTATIVLTTAHDNFEFAIDNELGSFQSSNVFNNLTPGIHTVYIRDINHCEIISSIIKVIGFPKYFTPNNDNTHDYWNIIGLDQNAYPNLQIFIYDRYGKLLSAFNPLTTVGWDGKHNKKALPQSDYWYSLQLPEGTTYKGHFTLRL
ncbi:T9SS type B sorting domain-containing protein [Olleya sp. HaHaR_3_96]|uniref:T9SS type B sorting domain-containing protein n=1 Tax=Olleya sp. HaHaR_3_96 TaxID=2745560 RepID=UPI001C4ECBDF|nr:T9SS type B sorting domain-containing protein [Olleya sp. HaHaR_3_96]QXP59410.1 T9SS type B sorting domain-containing protein [Olleya sp. HaHaR_3_96]